MKLKSTLAAFIVLTASSAYSANILYFAPATGTVGIGNTVTLQVKIDSVTNFAGYQFDLLFNNSLFSSTNIADGTIFTGGGNSDFFIPGTVSGGTISGTGNSLFGASGVNSTNGLLASFSFLAQAPGVGNFSFDLIDLIDSNGNQITPGTPGTAQITVTSATPEPATWTLLSAGIVVGGLLRRRNRPAAA